MVKHAEGRQTQRLSWLEGIRIFAAVMLLIYHAQLLMTDYAYAPTPTGLADNWQQLVAAGQKLGQGWLTQLTSFPAWFSYQFVDVFVLISGFSLVLSLKGQPLQVSKFFQKRFLRILLPFWTVAWVCYPVLWAIGKVTNSYIPDNWHIFAGITFPLLFDFRGELLLPTNGPWWFVPLILSFTLMFPVLWHLLHRWGLRNLLLISMLLTFGYRAIATYSLGGHPTYMLVEAPADWQPFVLFLAKLNIFVVGMIVAQKYSEGKGVIFWGSRKALAKGTVIYALGFISQFYQFGWIFGDFCLALGLSLCCMAILRAVTDCLRLEPLMTWLGSHSYSYFLIHNFVVDRTIHLVIKDNLSLYYQLLPVMITGTLALAVFTDYLTPILQQSAISAWQWCDQQLSAPVNHQPICHPRLGDLVYYQGQSGWTVIKVEQLNEQAMHLYRISDGKKAIWVNEKDLEVITANFVRQ